MNRYDFEAGALAAAHAVVRRLPRRIGINLGRVLGKLVAAVDQRHIAFSEENLRHAFPDWNKARIARTARGVYAYFGGMLFDMLWMHGRPRDEILALVDIIGREHIDRAMAAGRGVIMATGHVGNWEVLGLAHGWTFGPIRVVARPLGNPAVDRRISDFRAAAGNTIIYKRNALPGVIRTLRAGGTVGMLLDEKVSAEDGIFVEFFGRPAATTTVAAALALRTGCAVIPCHATLQPDGRYRVTYDPPLAVAPSGDRDADVAVLTQEVARRTEAWIRAAPEQWRWQHRRWPNSTA